MTFIKCAAIPNSAPPSHIHKGGFMSLESAIDEGSAAKAIAYGRGERKENLN